MNTCVRTCMKLDTQVHIRILNTKHSRHRQAVNASPMPGVPPRGPSLHLAGWPHSPQPASWPAPPPLTLSLWSRWPPQCPSGSAAVSPQSQSSVRNGGW